MPYITREICAGDFMNLSEGNHTPCLMDLQQQCEEKDCSSANPWPAIVPVLDGDALSGGQGNPVQTAPIVGFARVGITGVFRPEEPGGPGISFQRMCGGYVEATGGGRSCGLTAQYPVLIE